MRISSGKRYPAIWCECAYCRTARKNREIRRTAAYLIDDDTLVDFGPDIHWQITEFGIDLSRIRQVILTHPHGDHLSPLEFLWRKEWFSKVPHPVSLYGAPPSFAEILSFCARDSALLSLEEDLKLIPHPMGHNRRCETENKLEIFALDAQHAAGRQALLYLLSRNGKSVLIGNDSGWFPEQTWRALEGKSIDLAILDCTCGLVYPDARSGHMGAKAVAETWEKLRGMGCLNPGSRCLATHFSHNGGGTQAEFNAFFKPFGIEAAYDGLVIEL